MTDHDHTSAAARAGAPWTREEYQKLHAAASEGRGIEDAAAVLQRSTGAITARARRMLPPERTGTTNGWWWDLCELLEEDPHYPWQDALRAQGEALLDASTIHAIRALSRRDPSSLSQVEELVGCDRSKAASLLRRLGSDTETSPVSPVVTTLKIRNLLDGTSHLPTRGHPTDAGLDLRYSGLDPIRVTAERQELLPTGIAVAVPEGYAGLICPRSGLAAKHGLTVVNAPGVIDHGYTGEIRVCLGIVGTDNGYTVQPGERIAQLVLSRVLIPEVELVDSIADSDRGAGGFGSTGTT